MAPSPIKCTLQTFGTFSTPTFAGVGEPFNDGRQRARCDLAPNTYPAPHPLSPAVLLFWRSCPTLPVVWCWQARRARAAGSL